MRKKLATCMVSAAVVGATVAPVPAQALTSSEVKEVVKDGIYGSSVDYSLFNSRKKDVVAGVLWKLIIIAASVAPALLMQMQPPAQPEQP